MSLRYKALIAAILVVALVTGVLVVRAGDSYEQTERRRVKNQLEADAAALEDSLAKAAATTAARLEATSQSSELRELLRDTGLALHGNFAVWTDDWLSNADADLALAAIDALLAEERAADVLAPAGDLAMVAFSARKGLDMPQARRDAVMKDAGLTRQLNAVMVKADEFTAAARKAGRPAPAPAAPAVLVLDSRVFLAVIVPIYDSLQDYTVVGVVASLSELTTAWLAANFRVGTEGENAVYKVLLAGDIPAASTHPDAAATGPVLEAARQAGMGDFEFKLPAGDSRETYLALKTPFTLAPPDAQPRPGFIPFKSLDRELAPLRALQREIAGVGLALGALGAALAYAAAYSVIRRLRRLQGAAERVRNGDFDAGVKDSGRDEVAALGRSFNNMTTGLKALGLYTHETLARSVMDNPGLLGNASSREEGTVFFSDVKGFTSIAERLSAEQVTAQLNEYFGGLGHVLREQRGYVDKFIGDGVMAFWGPPFVADGDHAVRAVTAAVACVQAGATMRREWSRRGAPLFFQRIGIATGEVVVGNIGTATKKNFTVIGDTVNLASRLEGTNKLYGTEILVDETTALRARHAFLMREVDQIRVVGRSSPVRVFEPVGPLEATGTLRPEVVLYEQALAQYRARDLAGARAALGELLQGKPDDGPAAWLDQRCAALQQSSTKDWEPVTSATSK